jgi:hypothetical protein
MKLRQGQARTQPCLRSIQELERADSAQAADQNSDNDKHNSPQEIALEKLYYAEYDK